MPVAIISKTWLKSLGKTDREKEVMSEIEEEQGEEEVDADDLDVSADEEHSDSEPFRLGSGKRDTSDEDEEEEEDDDADDDAEDEADDHDSEVETQGEEDPLAPAYDLEHGTLLEDVDHAAEQSRPVRATVESAKEFFSTEILYRYDVLDEEVQDSIVGTYRVEVKGNKGGVWTLVLDQQVEVLNRKEEADIVLSLQSNDFLQLVNGELNPQIALLAQKIKVTGSIEKAIALQNLLVPVPE